MTDTGMNVANEIRLVAERFIGDRDYEFGGKLNEWADRIEAWQAALSAQTEARDAARPIDEYHEDMGPVAWWKFPIVEASYIGSPNFDDWPGYHTHFTPHPAIPSNHAAIDNAQATEGK